MGLVRGGIETADHFLAAVHTTTTMLASQPESGSLIFVTKVELKHNMRRFPVTDGFDKILLFYFPLEDGIDLVRIVRGSRDLDRLQGEGFFG